MKRSLLLSLLMLVCVAAFAQPPYYYNPGSATPNSWPFNLNNQKAQFLYLPGQFVTPTPAPSGSITSVWFKARTGATNTVLQGLKVDLGQTTATTFSPATTYLTAPVMINVRAAADLSIPTVTAGTWIEIPLDVPFVYDNTKSLVVEVSQTGVTNGFDLTFQAIATSARTIQGTNGSSSGTSYQLAMAGAGLTINFPCVKPHNVNITNITTTGADFDWQYQFPNIDHFEFVVDKTPGDPGNVMNFQPYVTPPFRLDTFQPNTCYYIHIRSNCVAGGIPPDTSGWVTDSFCTLPMCEIPPITIDVNKITSTTALVSWTAVPNVTKYEYAVSIDPQSPPQKGTFTTYTQVVLKGLHTNLPYFFYLRAYCSVGEPISPWGEVQFHTAMTTDVDDLNSGDFAIDAYPNPAGNTVTILTVGRSNNANISITDMTGKLVKTVAITEDRMVVGLDGLAPGLYFVRYNDEARSEVIKLTKQ